MNNITIQKVDDDLKNRLQKRAEHNGRSLSEEALIILKAVLTDTQTEPHFLEESIKRRFAHIGDFQIPEIASDSLREPPNFE